MELLFHEETIRYLSEKRFDQIYQEQTAEMTVPENRPEIRRIVDCFGLILVQNKTVDPGMLSVSGTIQAGVLYVPENEEGLERIDVVLPFSVTKKVTAEPGAQLFYWGWLKSLDARMINSRKVLVRANLGSELTLLEPAECTFSRLNESPEDLCCKTEEYRLKLPLCAAEKEIQIADEVLLPSQEPGIAELLKWNCVVEVADSRVIGDKAVFKGSAVLRCLYRSEDDALHVWTGKVPYSQYADLDRELTDGIITVQPIFRQAELDSDGQIDSHRLLINLTVSAQILVRGDVAATFTEDAYCLEGAFNPEWQSCELPVCLDFMQQTQTESVSLPPEAAQTLDWTVFSDASFNSASQKDRVVTPVSVNLLYWDNDRILQSKLLRIEIEAAAPDPGESGLRSFSVPGSDTVLQGRQLQIPIRMRLQYDQIRPMRNLCGGSIEEASNEDGPSLAAVRCSGDLWDIAKTRRSTVEALKAVNGLDTERLTETKLLLVPLGRAAKTAGEVKE